MPKDLSRIKSPSDGLACISTWKGYNHKMNFSILLSASLTDLRFESSSRSSRWIHQPTIRRRKGIGPVKLDFSRPEVSQNLFASLSDAIDHTKDTLIVIDELPLFLNIIDKEDPSHKNAGFLLNWFRSLRQVSGTKIRWIFCGSVGLHNFTSMRNLSMTINDMVSFDFDALSQEEAEGLILALSDSLDIPITGKTVQYILDKIEWYIPYFIQLLFTTIKNYPDAKNGITEQMVDSSFDYLAHTDDLSTWYERLAEYNGFKEGAELLLNALSMADNGLSRGELLDMFAQFINEPVANANTKFSLILNMIEHDGYIMRVSGGIRRFHSPLLKNGGILNLLNNGI